MLSTRLIVTGADSNYFPFVQSTIASIRMKEQGRAQPIAFLDLGCSLYELDWLKRAGVTLIRCPRRHFTYPSQADAPPHYTGNIARAFLPEYFPGWDTYLWIDADAWVCNWDAVGLCFAAAERRGCGVVSELSYNSPVLHGNLPGVHAWSRNYYEQVYGAAVADKYYSYPVLNNGVLALASDAPHWAAWQLRLEEGLNASPILLTDQMSLNLAIWEELQAHTEFLPAWCNWTTHAFGLPAWHVLDGHVGRWVEPNLPHQSIGILHLTASKSPRGVVQTTTGDSLEQPLIYPTHPQYTALV